MQYGGRKAIQSNNVETKYRGFHYFPIVIGRLASDSMFYDCAGLELNFSRHDAFRRKAS
jgi:hypothetical protein